MRVRRKIVPIDRYKKFDQDGWSTDLVMGLRIRDKNLVDARMGDLYEDGCFYDNDGCRFNATHALILKESDVRISTTLSVKMPFVPTKEQIKALEKASTMMPWDKELKGLLKGLKNG